jgi:hypothetical protein
MKKKGKEQECRCFKEAKHLAECFDIREGECVKCRLCGKKWYVGPKDKQTGYFSISSKKGDASKTQ